MKKRATSKPKGKAKKETVAPVTQPTGTLNPGQQQAVEHDASPLLIIAGAGTGKTMTLVHRVVHLLDQGVPPGRILLLTFTRRAAEELLRRVETLRRQKLQPEKEASATEPQLRRVWGGTFHAVGARLLRQYAPAIGYGQGFTILDRDDSEEFLEVLRTELKLTDTQKEFPKKGTCQSLHSGWINSGQKLESFIEASFPWCRKFKDGLKKLFETYAERKRQQNVVDFDDLLVAWNALLQHPQVGQTIRSRFDCVLVDEYQDTNPIQAEIVKRLRPDGTGVTVVGDDAQSIYSFRGATIRNILDFPKSFPGTTVLTLQENYRSTEPILGASNKIITQASEGFAKDLRSVLGDGERPKLVSCYDEYAEARYVVDQILQHRDAGVNLRQQAVLFRASHHSLSVEMELTRRKISFHKYGGLKFADAAHVKDLVAFLRLAENPRDLVSGRRLLLLLPGIGEKKAQTFMDGVVATGNLGSLWECKVPTKTVGAWGGFRAVLEELTKEPSGKVREQLDKVLHFYLPLLRETYDDPQQRQDDLHKLRDLSDRYEDRTSFLAEFTLDPPASTSDLAQAAALEKDYLVLSTIHSAKGLEWDAVFVINATDGAIPSSRAMGNPAQLDEELRLFYVALTRAKTWLNVTYPRERSSPQASWRDEEAPMLTRFLPQSMKKLFEMVKQ